MPCGLGVPHLFWCVMAQRCQALPGAGITPPSCWRFPDDTERVEAAGMVWERCAILTFLPALALERFAQLSSHRTKKSIAARLVSHLAGVRPTGCLACLVPCFVLFSLFSCETLVCVCLVGGFLS